VQISYGVSLAHRSKNRGSIAVIIVPAVTAPDAEQVDGAPGLVLLLAPLRASMRIAHDAQAGTVDGSANSGTMAVMIRYPFLFEQPSKRDFPT
jgi:hypothetical protein